MLGSIKYPRWVQVLCLFGQDISLPFVKPNPSLLQELTCEWVARRFGTGIRICLYLLQKFKGLCKGTKYMNVGVTIEQV